MLTAAAVVVVLLTGVRDQRAILLGYDTPAAGVCASSCAMYVIGTTAVSGFQGGSASAASLS